MATYTWHGTNGDLTSAANWTVNGNAVTKAPSATDDVIFPGGAKVFVSQNAAQALSLTYQSLTVESGATLTFPSYGTVSINAPVTNNGTLQSGSSGSLAFQNSITGSGTLSISGGVKVRLDADASFGQLNVTGRGNLTVSGVLAATAASVSNGGTVTTAQDVNITTLAIEQGGHLSTSGNLNTDTVSVTGGSTLYVHGDMTVFKKLSIASTVTVDGQIILGHTDAKDASLELKDGQNLTAGTGMSVHGASVTAESVYTATGVSAPNYMKTGVHITCFLAGSMIRTADGEVAVENIQVGDQLVAFDWKSGQETLRPVIWAGRARARIRPDLPDDEAGWPVRVLKDAISDGVPYKDMLITAEHCLFFKDRFIPVRMLVNQVSIFYDKSLTDYDYYHVETSQHSVVMADGMLTESYLDTGNRGSFKQVGRVVTLGAGRRNWAEHGAAPLCVARERVEPVFQALVQRADATGALTARHMPDLTEDADVHLETACGKSIRKIRQRGGMVSFMLPAGVTQVRLISRASRPCDVTGPFVDDRRRLGVLVGDAVLREGNQPPRSLMPDILAPALPGWHEAGTDGGRWTDGYALLPLPARQPDTLTLLTLTLLSGGPYLRDEPLRCKHCVNG